ncbi:oxaloacetate decarboxylase [Carnobacterium sp. ISL-102]|uniref:oxaloacetate decarboxylase n=1 Tax=Carnobacterium TaxID=2747 RepID=UPI001BE69C1B|nr:oxaloacetate decarboxylase [Carnobacterium sp. ISL-102]MBT2732857.1 oxaloacetate decarboxylase [Carnobacterium sp. ISL-102]
MERFSYLDIVVIAVVGLLVIFLVLISWQLIRQLILLGSKSAKMNSKTDVLVQTKQDSSAMAEDDETKMVAVLMALILANEDQQDKSYQITKIERIR